MTNPGWEVNTQLSNLRGSLLQVANLKFKVSVRFIYKLQFPQSKLQHIPQYNNIYELQFPQSTIKIYLQGLTRDLYIALSIIMMLHLKLTPYCT